MQMIDSIANITCTILSQINKTKIKPKSAGKNIYNQIWTFFSKILHTLCFF